ncbi:MAG: hypothetical protein KA120_01240 [Candidatus Goldbacteria bacterium]|nr:hypothetical protein [Candidatus Goldiibacteriota bacterium]
MRNVIEIKKAAKYFKVSENTLNKFLRDCKYQTKGNLINVDKLNAVIVKKSLKNLKKENRNDY